MLILLILLLSSEGDDDDEDAPMISGFSDDVPMVIAQLDNFSLLHFPPTHHVFLRPFLLITCHLETLDLGLRTPRKKRKHGAKEIFLNIRCTFFRFAITYFFIYNICGCWTLQALTEANCEEVCQWISRLTEQGKDPIIVNSHTSSTFA